MRGGKLTHDDCPRDHNEGDPSLKGKRQYKQIGERVALDVALNEIDKGVPMGFEPLESEVGWDFEENVGYEEDGESDIVLLSAQL